MYTSETIDKFVELRAQGWSLGHIATELHVSKRTLVEWNREYAADIKALHAVELELLQEKFLASREEKLTRLARLQKDVDDELANRPLKFLPIEKLFRLAVDLRQEIDRAGLDKDLPEGSARRGGNGQPDAATAVANGTTQR